MKANITATNAASQSIVLAKRHGVIYRQKHGCLSNGEPKLAILMCAGLGADLWALVDPFETTFYLDGKIHKWKDMRDMLVDGGWEPAPAGTCITFENTSD